jgi:hypothetical protein
LLKKDAVSGKVAFSRRSFKNMPIQPIVKIKLKQVTPLHLRLSEQASMKVTV